MSDHIDKLVTMLQQDSPFRDGTPSYKSWRNERDNAAVELATIARENAAEADRWRKVAERLAISAGVANWHMLVTHGHTPDDGYIEKSARVEIAEALATVEQEEAE